MVSQDNGCTAVSCTHHELAGWNKPGATKQGLIFISVTFAISNHYLRIVFMQ